MSICKAIFTALALLSIAATSATAQPVTAENFQPPFRGGQAEISEPTAIKDSGDVIAAASAQDAVLAALVANVEVLKTPPLPKADNTSQGPAARSTTELGAHFVKFPSGEGAVATGMSVYSSMPNPNASRIAQRNSFVIAYTRAKRAMVQLLGETSTEGRTILTNISKTIDGQLESTTASTETVEESIRQAGNALLKGYVVFDVKEEVDPNDKDLRMVFVTLASSPKTQKLTLRNGALQSSANLRSGIQSVLDEVQQGVVPPVGGRVVTVPGSGETAIIGFGSALVRQGPTPAMTARGKLTSRTISGTRARDALSGIINGDKTMWAVGIPSKVESSFKASIDYSTEHDPNTASEDVAGSVRGFEQQFLSNEVVRDEVQSIRKGTLPPGVQEKHWFSEDGHWSYTMVVYYPAASTKASQFSDAMRETTLKAPVGSAAKQSGTGKRRNNADVKPMKSGVVSPKNEL